MGETQKALDVIERKQRVLEMSRERSKSAHKSRGRERIAAGEATRPKTATSGEASLQSRGPREKSREEVRYERKQLRDRELEIAKLEEEKEENEATLKAVRLEKLLHKPAN